MSRSDVKDAAYHYMRDLGIAYDAFCLLAFDSGGGDAPTLTDVEDHVRARAPRIPGLRVRLRDAPGKLEHPYWVRDDSPVVDRIVAHDLDGASWSEFEKFVGELVLTRLDLREQAWRLHVVSGVRGVPMVDGVATITILQVGHAVTDGLGVTRLARALFAPPDAPAGTIEDNLPGHGPVDDPGGSVFGAAGSVFGAAGAVLRIPIDLVRYLRESRRAGREYVGAPAPKMLPATVLNGEVGPVREVRIVPIRAGDVRVGDASITVSTLVAVGSSLSTALGRTDPPRALAAFVPMALPRNTAWPSANRVVVGTVDLHVEETDPIERAALIRRSLRAEHARVTAEPYLRIIRAQERVPGPVVRLVMGRRYRNRIRTPQRVAAQTTVVSVDRGPADLRLGTSRVRFTTGFSFPEDGRLLNHGFFGLGDTLTVTTVASPVESVRLGSYTQGLVDELRRDANHS